MSATLKIRKIISAIFEAVQTEKRTMKKTRIHLAVISVFLTASLVAKQSQASTILRGATLCVPKEEDSAFMDIIRSLDESYIDGKNVLYVFSSRHTSSGCPENFIQNNILVTIVRGSETESKGHCVLDKFVDYFIKTVGQLGSDEVAFSTSVDYFKCSGHGEVDHRVNVDVKVSSLLKKE